MFRVALVIMTCVVMFYRNGLYDFHLLNKPRYRTRREILARVLAGSGIAFLVLAGVYFIFPALSIGRGVVLFAAPLVLVLTLAWRMMLAPGSPQLRF
jgi:hypothetical protein